MAIDIDHIATLARLALTASERERFGAQLERILAYVDELDAVDTDDVPATTHVLPVSMPLRPDEPEPPLDRDLALSQAPEHDDGAFVVPRTV